ncbi:SH3 domain-containing protein [Streptomyces nanshensis]|uniref:SH3b domain-containing protein n=1 Tax=Streptomyces nanshensis TaxID=518642 RepID=A0A1E7KZ87_9ACTN|nr:SH3 domain-containing protein [Streptomyces nanshensis]OEV09239.1 hypothetical protein AN218_22490 [Streptomyces nanshensis]
MKCARQHENYRSYISASGVNLRTGPGTGYTSVGTLSKGTDVMALCSNKGRNWEKVRILQGRHKGKVNWVYDAYVPVPMEPSTR